MLHIGTDPTGRALGTSGIGSTSVVGVVAFIANEQLVAAVSRIIDFFI